jgi:proline iminopeptidase
MHEFTSRRVDIGDSTLEVLEAGEGDPTFVCTHPYADTTGPHPAGGLSDAFADAGRTFYLVPRGTGRSDPEQDPEKLGMHQTVDDLDAVRRALGVERWVVGGASTGGMTAVEYALRYPDSTSGLVSVGGASSWKFVEDPDCIYNPEHPEAWREEQARNALDGSEEAGRQWIRTVLELSLHRKELLDQLVDGFQISGPRLARIREELIGRWDREDDLVSVRVPALVACGRYDTQCPLAASLLMAERLPNATLVVFEESNHFPYAEEPTAFRQAVAELAARVEA